MWHTLTPRQIEFYCTLNGYRWQVFRLLLVRAADHVPCLLCGEIHALHVHTTVGRKVRSPETGENVAIRIISIICRRAKERGRQYTKRLLPAFVIPFCQIGREGVVAYLRQFPDGKVIYRIGSALLGARDPRTIRRHLQMGRAQLGEAALMLAALLSEVPAYASIPPRLLTTSDATYLHQLSEQADRGRRRTLGGSACKIPSLVYLHLVGVFSRCSKPLAPPLTCVVRALLFHDTS